MAMFERKIKPANRFWIYSSIN